MKENQLSYQKSEQQLLSKESIKLSPRQRLELLLKTQRYPVVKKRSSAKAQLSEMIDFFNLCCIMLAQFFPNYEAEKNFLMLSIIESQKNKSIITERLAEAFKLLKGYEELENRVTAIQMLFYQYQYSFPELYSSYNLEDITTKRISDVIHETKQLITNDTQFIESILNRWGLLS